MESNLSKSNSDLHHNSVLFKNFSSPRLSRDILVSIDEYSSTDKDSHGHHKEGPSLAILFTWESQPGTPKVKFYQRKFPPLTPPPSYFYCTPTRSTKNPKPSFLRTIFPRLRSKKSHSPESPASSSSSSSWSSSPWPSATRSIPTSRVTALVAVNNLYRRRASMPSYRLRFDANMNDVVEHESDSVGSSPLCFGLSRGGNPRSQGSYCL